MPLRDRSFISRRPDTGSTASVLSERGKRARRSGEGSRDAIIIVSWKTLVLSCFAHRRRGALCKKRLCSHVFSSDCPIRDRHGVKRRSRLCVSSRQFVPKKGTARRGRGCPFPFGACCDVAARISLLNQHRKTEPRKYAEASPPRCGNRSQLDAEHQSTALRSYAARRAC